MKAIVGVDINKYKTILFDLRAMSWLVKILVIRYIRSTRNAEEDPEQIFSAVFWDSRCLEISQNRKIVLVGVSLSAAMQSDFNGSEQPALTRVMTCR